MRAARATARLLIRQALSFFFMFAIPTAGGCTIGRVLPIDSAKSVESAPLDLTNRDLCRSYCVA
jgi:hypothetical protein